MVNQQGRSWWHFRFLLYRVIPFALAIGCQQSVPSEEEAAVESVDEAPVRLLVIEDSGLAEEIQRQWALRTDQQIVVRERRWEELAAARRLAADVVIYPAGYLGELAERRLLAPIPPDVIAGPDVGRDDLLPLQRQLETVWGKKTMALSFGSPILVLYYREDVLEDLGVAVPQTWDEYQAVVSDLNARHESARIDQNRDVSETTTQWVPALEPLDAIWSAQLLLARAVGYAKHPEQVATLFETASMKPRIDSEPFVRALNELAQCQEGVPEAWRSLGPSEVRELFHKGHCALALTWPSANGETSDKTRGAFRIAPIPGSLDVFDSISRAWSVRKSGREVAILLGVSGRLGSVTWETGSPRAAARLLALMTGPEIATEVSARDRDTTVFRESQLSRVEQWVERAAPRRAAQDYSDVIHAAQTIRDVVFSPRIPGRTSYLTALAEAVRRRLVDGTDAAVSLAEAARQWEEITDSLGRDQQRLAYRRSLGMQ
ncbi:MAG: extracellular solute-binding protein [Planctomycetota bacterium]|nr:extracellular solute-binding protein [Planctomycetota bacterium]